MTDTPLRILYHHRIAASDGMRVHIAELIGALKDQGHIVKIVGPEGSESKEAGAQSGLLERTADLVRKYLPSAASEVLELLYNIPAYIRLSREASAFKPDLIYERYNLFLLAGLHFAQKHKIPLIMEINSPLAEERAKFGKLALKRLANRCETWLWSGADIALPVSEVLATHVRRRRGDLKTLRVVHNGARQDPSIPKTLVDVQKEKLGLNNAEVVLGFVGFIRDWHGVGWAIEALTNLQDGVHLLIVGDGPARPALEARAAELDVSNRVHFTGAVPHNAVALHVECCDIALQTASVAYASPLKLFEYMVQAKAIIAPDQPNIREILEPGETALLFTPGDQNAFEAALQKACSDHTLRQRLGQGARNEILSRPFTWANNGKIVADLGSSLLN